MTKARFEQIRRYPCSVCGRDDIEGITCYLCRGFVNRWQPFDCTLGKHSHCACANGNTRRKPQAMMVVPDKVDEVERVEAMKSNEVLIEEQNEKVLK